MGILDETSCLHADPMAADLKEIWASGGHPPHFKVEESVEICYGDNWERLQILKRKLDGRNVFQAVPSLAST
jgi:hypothetical protein